MTWSFGGGLPETVCGYGSTLRGSEEMRGRLPELFGWLGVRTLIDAPCGDWNWMARTNLSGIDYIGVDSDLEIIGKAFSRKTVPPDFAPKSRSLKRWDVIRYGLPCRADAVLCRDFMQHLPYEDIDRVLKHFIKSGTPWIILTNHAVGFNGADLVERGRFRPINFCLPPFAFPMPSYFIADGPERSLAAWTVAEMLSGGFL